MAWLAVAHWTTTNFAGRALLALFHLALNLFEVTNCFFAFVIELFSQMLCCIEHKVCLHEWGQTYFINFNYVLT